MKTNSVIKFKDHAKATPVRADLPEHATVLMLPVIHVERVAIKEAPQRVTVGRPKRRRLHGSIGAQRLRDTLDEQAMTVERCLMWLHDIAAADHDPRAIVELLATDDEFGAMGDLGDVNATMAWLASFTEAWNRRMMRKTPPRLIDDPELA